MRFAALITRLVGLWIVCGAALKLFLGSPADLPQVVRDLPLGAALTFKLAIGLELAIGAVALLRPRRGWPLVGVLLAVFLVVLGMQVAQDEASCGCFGAAVTIPPETMFAIDGTLLLLLLLSRPWRLDRVAFQMPWGALALVVLVGVVLPWVVDREAATPENVGDGSGLRRYVDLDWQTWKGKPLEETSLGPWLEDAQRVKSGVLVIWRASCEVCGDHLMNLASEETGARDVVLLKLPKEYDDEENKVEILPEGEWVQSAELPGGVIWLVTPPVHVEVEDGIVRVVTQGMDVLR